jgi:hypothetical protein
LLDFFSSMPQSHGLSTDVCRSQGILKSFVGARNRQKERCRKCLYKCTPLSASCRAVDARRAKGPSTILADHGEGNVGSPVAAQRCHFSVARMCWTLLIWLKLSKGLISGRKERHQHDVNAWVVFETSLLHRSHDRGKVRWTARTRN